MKAGDTQSAPAAESRAGGVYLTERLFCDRYHVSPRTAQRWRLEGCGPPFIRFGKRILYESAACEGWAAARTFASTAEAKVRGA